MNTPVCPHCQSVHVYEDGELMVCPECGQEWPKGGSGDVGDDAPAVKDANGTVLHDGDTVTIVKDLKVKGASSALKVGTRVKNIRLVEGDHNIDCRIDGFGAMKLKSEFVRKA
jgi:protein PhnA